MRTWNGPPRMVCPKKRVNPTLKMSGICRHKGTSRPGLGLAPRGRQPPGTQSTPHLHDQDDHGPDDSHQFPHQSDGVLAGRVGFLRGEAWSGHAGSAASALPAPGQRSASLVQVFLTW